LDRIDIQAAPVSYHIEGLGLEVYEQLLCKAARSTLDHANGAPTAELVASSLRRVMARDLRRRTCIVTGANLERYQSLLIVGLGQNRYPGSTHELSQ
jgi:hypothetical protein